MSERVDKYLEWFSIKMEELWGYRYSENKVDRDKVSMLLREMPAMQLKEITELFLENPDPWTTANTGINIQRLYNRRNFLLQENAKLKNRGRKNTRREYAIQGDMPKHRILWRLDYIERRLGLENLSPFRREEWIRLHNEHTRMLAQVKREEGDKPRTETRKPSDIISEVSHALSSSSPSSSFSSSMEDQEPRPSSPDPSDC